VTVVVHLTSVHPWNDTRIFLKMARSLAASGYETHLVAIDRKAGVERQFERDGVTVHLLRGDDITSRKDRMLIGAPRVLDALPALKPDLVHFHDPELIPFALARAGRFRFIYDAHENVPELVHSREWLPHWLRSGLKTGLAALEWLACKRFAAVIGATPSIAARFPPEKSACIQNLPIATELAAPEGAAMAWEDRPQRGIYVGGISELRGIVQLVDALDLCHAIDGFDLVGTFDSDALLARVAERPGWKKVHYHGQLGRAEVAALLNRVRFGAVTFLPVPNHIDAQPNKLFEYLSAGLPVLASHFPLWKEILGDRLAEYVDPDDARSVADGMGRLLAAPEKEQRMRSAEGQRRIVNELNWDREFERLRALYDRLLAGTNK
jgi:glycosyltransferase involved in cell wall biosynthesis